MYQRERHRSGSSGHASRTPARRGAAAVLALQRMIGNHGTTQLIARDRKKGKKNKGNFARSVTVEKLGEIEVVGGNIEDWRGKKTPNDLLLTTTKGEHSDELKKLADNKTKLSSLEIHVVVGENTMLTITFTPARVMGYEASTDGKTESWKVVDFEGVHREQLSIGKAR